MRIFVRIFENLDGQISQSGNNTFEKFVKLNPDFFSCHFDLFEWAEVI